MKFSSYIAYTMKGAFSSSCALGLILGVLVLVTGGVEGEITLDIDFSTKDSLWFFLGIPALISTLFLFVSPLSYLIHRAVFRGKPVKLNDDV